MMKSRIITICGSLKFEGIMKEISEKLEFEGNCVLSVIYPTKSKDSYSSKEIESLSKMHLQRIEMSDAIFIVNVDGYIGEATTYEMNYAKSLNKEILSLVPLTNV